MNILSPNGLGLGEFQSLDFGYVYTQHKNLEIRTLSKHEILLCLIHTLYTQHASNFIQIFPEVYLLSFIWKGQKEGEVREGIHWTLASLHKCPLNLGKPGTNSHMVDKTHAFEHNMLPL